MGTLKDLGAILETGAGEELNMGGWETGQRSWHCSQRIKPGGGTGGGGEAGGRTQLDSTHC